MEGNAMNNIPNAKLRLSCKPEGNDTEVTLTAQWDGVVLAVDKLDLAKPRQCASFVKRVSAECNYIDRKALESSLLAIANMMSGREQNPAAYAEASAEIYVSQIVRPERFITPEVSGLAVPTVRVVGNEVRGEWLLHLQWTDGKRERQLMAPAIELPSGRPPVHLSRAERTNPQHEIRLERSGAAKWLEGASAPSPADVFKAICERIAYFLDLHGEHAKGVTVDAGGVDDVDLRLFGLGCRALFVHWRSPRVGQSLAYSIFCRGWCSVRSLRRT